MKKKIEIICPECGKKSDIYFSRKPNTIVMNCPHCHTPLVYEDSKVELISVLNSKSAKLNSARELISTFLGREPMEGFGENREIISEDDIINLKIELFIHDDVSEFINNI